MMQTEYPPQSNPMPMSKSFKLIFSVPTHEQSRETLESQIPSHLIGANASIELADPKHLMALADSDAR